MEEAASGRTKVVPVGVTPAIVTTRLPAFPVATTLYVLAEYAPEEAGRTINWYVPALSRLMPTVPVLPELSHSTN